MLCPKCGREMELVSLEGVVIDRCADHGLWFDKGELEKVNAAKWRKQHRMTDMAVRRAKNDAKLKGIFLGWLSFLFD